MGAVEDGYSLYRRFFAAPPTGPVREWSDPETGATAWLVMNSLRGGAAGGGTRMRHGGTLAEATFLAKTMEIKFRVSGPDIGGAKTVINFTPDDPRKRDVMERWYRHIADDLQYRYGTGSDLNTDFQNEVAKLTFIAAGVRNPQEGIVRGLGYTNEEVRVATGRLNEGLGASVPERVPTPTVADMVTGFGLAVAVQHTLRCRGEDVAGKRVTIEGFGVVGGSAAHYLEQLGALIVGVSTKGDAQPAPLVRLDPLGLDVAGLLETVAQNGRALTAADANASGAAVLWATPADIFVAAGPSATITPETVAALGEAGVQMIACGANDPFAEQTYGDTKVQELADSRFIILPDFIANCGTARSFAVLMDPRLPADPASLFANVEATIRDALDEVLGSRETSLRGILGRAYQRYVSVASMIEEVS